MLACLFVSVLAIMRRSSCQVVALPKLGHRVEGSSPASGLNRASLHIAFHTKREKLLTDSAGNRESFMHSTGHHEQERYVLNI